jgi:hypothetical protein
MLLNFPTCMWCARFGGCYRLLDELAAEVRPLVHNLRVPVRSLRDVPLSSPLPLVYRPHAVVLVWGMFTLFCGMFALVGRMFALPTPSPIQHNFSNTAHLLHSE